MLTNHATYRPKNRTTLAHLRPSKQHAPVLAMSGEDCLQTVADVDIALATFS
jgi:hypothetical protein